MPGILPAPATRVNGCGKGFGYRSAPPRPLASRRSDAPPSLVAALLSPDDAAPLPLAPSARPVLSLRGAQPRRLPSSLRSSVHTTPRRSHSLPHHPPSARIAALTPAASPPRRPPPSRPPRTAP